ncbi:glycosyltransferase family 9 protein [candidate division FCPU426 bacterium]|nr:glycosyltransferase family 9 protein [candidate division FCPU426 bacterium]
MRTGEKNILVCRTDALGDTLLALPVCTALKKAFPGSRVCMLVSPRTRDLVMLQAGVDQAISYDRQGVHRGLGLRGLIAELKGHAFDLALAVFPDRRVSWALLRAGIPCRVGTGRRWWSFLYTRRVKHSRAQAEKHEAEYNLDLVRELGVRAELQAPCLEPPPEARAWARDYLRQQGVAVSDRLVAIHPGGRGSAANWGAERYGRLANMIMKQFQCKIVLTGTPQEQKQLQVAAGYCEQAVLRLEQAISLPQFAALLACARVVVAGNTGPLHLACAVGTAVVSVFPASGVTGPLRWGPLGRKAAVLTPARENPLAVEQVPLESVAGQVGQWLLPAE